MKVLSFKNLIGAAAIGGIAYYVKQQGGLRSAWENLAGKANSAKDDLIGKAHEVTESIGQTAREKTDFASTPGGAGYRH